MTYMSRDERKSHILRQFKRVKNLGGKPSLTMREIAAYIDMKPSSHLMKMLLEMATEGGILKCKTDIHRKATGALANDIKVFRFYIEYDLPMDRFLSMPIIRINGEIISE